MDKRKHPLQEEEGATFCSRKELSIPYKKQVNFAIRPPKAQSIIGGEFKIFFQVEKLRVWIEA